MITNLQLLRNVGRFDSVASAANIVLARLTLIYAENGRGKTTLAAIFRSLATGDPLPIAERRRLAAQHPPHVIIACAGGPPPAMFQNGTWNRTLPNIAVFDDIFVDKNVYSGLAVVADHRQNLHELILGAQGVALNQQLQQLIAQIETHNSSLRQRTAAIPMAKRGAFSVDEFCALAPNANVDREIQAAERNLAATREQEPIRNTPGFDLLNLPEIDLNAIDQVLRTDLPALDATSAARVQAHLAAIGEGGEGWVADGMTRMPGAEETGTARSCPFCAQNLSGSPVMNHYRAFFSEAYRDLKGTVSDALTTFNQTHGGDASASFERSVRVLGERRQFWSRFCDVPDVAIDTASVARDWQTAEEAVSMALNAKQAGPLERMTLSDAARASVTQYESHRQALALINEQLEQANARINAVKQRAATGNVNTIQETLVRLQATKARHMPATAALCDAYLLEKHNKTATEQLRDQGRVALEQYRTTVFPNYQAAINGYLARFNAEFRLAAVEAANTRGGPVCTYNVVINNVAIPVGGGEELPGTPSFRNTLSSGDRNTLALAFFSASLDLDPVLANKVVVFDDPISSLDEHRSLTTVQEIRRLAARASQVIVLSHSKLLLCRIWEGTDPTLRTALQVTRDGTGSTIALWNVDQDCITEHDRRHAELRAYLVAGTQNAREVARSIRPLLEAFLRVACPEHFPPGTMLGQFRRLCEQRVNTDGQILNAHDIEGLCDIVEYANRFHHDGGNASWDTEVPNDGELRGFVQRALAFAKR